MPSSDSIDMQVMMQFVLAPVSVTNSVVIFGNQAYCGLSSIAKILFLENFKCELRA
jgi:hypothetical protein